MFLAFNRLRHVEDLSGNAAGFLDAATNNYDEFLYNRNGALVRDMNFGDGEWIAWTYAATGERLRIRSTRIGAWRLGVRPGHCGPRRSGLESGEIRAYGQEAATVSG